jgi:hypothetical protein|tara:strand:+ start:2027 stop:2233 length:207 start_codon:yes stop_codon:yes gene_type:complete
VGIENTPVLGPTKESVTLTTKASLGALSAAIVPAAILVGGLYVGYLGAKMVVTGKKPKLPFMKNEGLA